MELVLFDSSWLYTEYVTNRRSSRDIAKQLGCAKSTVIRKLREFGININKAGTNIDKDKLAYHTQIHNMPTVAFGKANDPEWLKTEYITKNRSALSISKELKLSKTAVYRWIRKFGLVKTKLAKQRAIEEGYLESTGYSIRSDSAARKRMTGRNTTRLDTVKAGTIWCHSSWEVHVARALDAAPQVVEFGKDITVIPYALDGKPRRFYVDFTVTFNDGAKALIEVKADKLLSERQTVAKLKAMFDYCDRSGIRSMVVGGKNKLRINDLKLD